MFNDDWYLRWEWEKSKKLVVFSITNDDNYHNTTYVVVQYLLEMINEFDIPLKVIDRWRY